MLQGTVNKGGGRSSARETIARCVAGALAKLVLTRLGIEVWAYTSQVGELSLSGDYNRYDFDEIEKNPVRCPDADMAKRMEEYIGKVKSEGDTVGGVVTCVVRHVPAGLGEPVFDKLHPGGFTHYRQSLRVVDYLEKDGKGGILGGVLSGNRNMAVSVARTLLNTMPQAKKDELVVQLINKNRDKLLQKGGALAAKNGVRLQLCDVAAKKI